MKRLLYHFTRTISMKTAPARLLMNHKSVLKACKQCGIMTIHSGKTHSCLSRHAGKKQGLCTQMRTLVPYLTCLLSHDRFNFDRSASSLCFVLYFSCFIFLFSVIFFGINELISGYFDLNLAMNISG